MFHTSCHVKHAIDPFEIFYFLCSSMNVTHLTFTFMIRNAKQSFDIDSDSLLINKNFPNTFFQISGLIQLTRTLKQLDKLLLKTVHLQVLMCENKFGR